MGGVPISLRSRMWVLEEACSCPEVPGASRVPEKTPNVYAKLSHFSGEMASLPPDAPRPRLCRIRKDFADQDYGKWLIDFVAVANQLPLHRKA